MVCFFFTLLCGAAFTEALMTKVTLQAKIKYPDAQSHVCIH